jgi:ribosomal protein L16 Arg81 hydroxylase
MRKRKLVTMVRQMMVRYDCDADSTNDDYRVLLISGTDKNRWRVPRPCFPFSPCAC